MNDIERQILLESFEIIKKISMERAIIINDGDHNSCQISLVFSTFCQLFIDFYSKENRVIKSNEFIELFKSHIEESLRDEENNRSLH